LLLTVVLASSGAGSVFAQPPDDERAQPDERVSVAILVFDGVQIIDFTAPWEIFGQAHFQIFSVSPGGEAVTTSMGMHLTPDYGFANAPHADVLLVPGGHVHDLQADPEALDWIRRTSEAAEQVLSVCNGAFLLAEAGLLDGGTATTFHGLLDSFEVSFPRVHLVRDQRYTDNGKVLTSAGLSSGIDASLYLVSKLRGMDQARALALHLEYNWDPHTTFARGAMADRHIPNVPIHLPDGAELHEISSLGDKDSWVARWSVEPRLEPRAVVGAFAKALAEIPGWKATGEPGPSGMNWRFSTENDGAWRLALTVTDGEDRQIVSATLERNP
jgi:putative intracellular protease/amidase